MRNLTEIYLMWHSTGFPGSWLCWFINQHNNFPKMNGSFLYDNVMHTFAKPDSHQPLHFSSGSVCNASLLKNVDGDGYVVSDEYTDIHDWVGTNLDNQDNLDTSKIILKFFRNHAPRDISDQFIDCINKEVTVKKNITLISGSADKVIANRLNDLIPKDRGPMDVEKVNIIDKANIHYYFPKLDALAPTHTVNFGNLLNYDHEEYNKLLIEIDEEPLDNWKELVDIIRQVFNQYK